MEKEVRKSAVICSWEEKSSLIWHCTVSESQTPLHLWPLGDKFPNADSNPQSPQRPARQVLTRFSLSPLPGSVDTPKTQGPALLFPQKATWCTGVSPHISGPTTCSSCEVYTLRWSDFVTHFGFCTSFFQAVPFGFGTRTTARSKRIKFMHNKWYFKFTPKKNLPPEKMNFFVFLWHLCEQ